MQRYELPHEVSSFQKGMTLALNFIGRFPARHGISIGNTFLEPVAFYIALRTIEVEVSMSVHFSMESEGAKSAQASFRNDSDSPGNLDDVAFLRLPDVKALTGLSKTSLYALVRERSFPAPVRLGPRAVAWVRAEVRQWAANRVLASRDSVRLTGSKRMPQAVRSVPAASSRRSA